jgi:hypothetical protein
VYPERITWEARDQVESYRVQAWVGSRLLFEETVLDATLPLTPSMTRVLAPFDSVEVQVRPGGSPMASCLERFWLRPQPDGDR